MLSGPPQVHGTCLLPVTSHKRANCIGQLPLTPAPCFITCRHAARTGLPTTREVEAAEALGRDVYEYVRQIDYDQVGAAWAA